MYERIGKKIITAMIAIALSISIFPIASSNASSNTREYVYDFSDIKITSFEEPSLNFTKIELGDCFPVGGVGTPEIPVFATQILIPNNKHVKRIDVSALETEEIALENPVMPVQKALPLNENISGNFSFDSESYDANKQVFGRDYANKTFIGYAKGYPILSITLYPVDYNPYLNKLFYHAKMKVTVTYEDEFVLSQNPFLRNSNEDKVSVRDFVDNPSDVNTYNAMPLPMGDLYPGGLCVSGTTYKYVIITNNALKNTTGCTYNWASLLDHRHAFSGLSGTIVTVEEINACSDYWNSNPIFNDSQAKIREFCKDAYLDWGTEYILLGGDWDDSGSQIVPFRDFICGYGTTGNGVYACDLYYANLDGTWYAADGYFGGYVYTYGHDIYSELVVARLTVSTAQQISNIVSKIIWYDSEADNSFLKNADFFGGNLGWPVTSAEYMEDIRNGTGDYYTDTDGFVQWNAANPPYSFNISTRKYYDWGASTPQDWRNLINNNSVAIINHLGHGNPFYTLGGMTVSTLTNTKYIFIYTQECSSGRFREGQTTEKYWTVMGNYGAVATIQNSGYGWGSGYDTNGPNQYMQRCFWDYMFKNGVVSWKIGDALTYARNLMGIRCYDGGDYGTHGGWFGPTLFGDPAMRLKSRASGAEHDCGITIDSVQDAKSGDHVKTSSFYYINLTVFNFGNHTETNINVTLKQDGIYKNSTTISTLGVNNFTLLQLGWMSPATDADGLLLLTANLTIPTDDILDNNYYNKTVVLGPDIGLGSYSYGDVMKHQNTSFSVYAYNDGFTNETVSVKFRVNGTEKSSKTITLNSTELKTVNFLWDGSTYPVGGYYINITVAPVANELYKANQNLSAYVKLYAIINATLSFKPQQNTTGSYMNVSASITSENAIASVTISIDGEAYQSLSKGSGTIYYYNKTYSMKGYYGFSLHISSNYYTKYVDSYFTVYALNFMIWNQNKSTRHPSLRQAIDAASENNTIRIPNSTFKGNAFINKRLHIFGNSSQLSIINGRGTNGFILNATGASHIEISRLTFENCSNGIYIHGEAVRHFGNESDVRPEDAYFENNSCRNIIQNCTFNTSTTGIYARGTRFNEIHNNNFEQDMYEGIKLSYESSMYLHAGLNNISHNNFSCAGHSPSINGLGIELSFLGHNHIFSNNFTDTASKDIYYGIYSTTSASNEIYQNIFNVHGKNAIYLVQSDRTGLSSYGNIVYNNTITHISTLSGYDTAAIYLSMSVIGRYYEYIHDNKIFTVKHGITCANSGSYARSSYLKDNDMKRLYSDGTAAYGIYLYAATGGTDTVYSCNITGYTTGIYATSSAGGASTIHNCNFFSNVQYGIYNAGSFILNARYCFWNSTDGPGGAGSGSGDNVSTNVLYLPFNEEGIDGLPDSASTLSNPYPGNGTIDVNANPALNITAADADGDTVNISFRSNSSGNWALLGTVNGTRRYGAAVSSGFETISWYESVNNDGWMPNLEGMPFRYKAYSNAHDGEYVAELRYYGAVGVESIYHSVPLANYTFVNFTFWFNMHNLENGDYLKVYYYNGTAQILVQSYTAIDYTDSTWYRKSITITPSLYNFNDNARICAELAGSLSMGDSVWLDDLSINKSIGTGTYSMPTSFAESQTYWWSANATDGQKWTNETYHFTIGNITTYLITPKNQSTNFNKQPNCKIWANDTNGGTLTVNFYENSTGSWIKRQLNSSVPANSTVQWNYSQATTYIKYWWKTTIDDGTTNISNIYHFTIKTNISTVYLIEPKNQSTTTSRQPKCRIWANDSDGDTLTVNFYANSTGSWIKRQLNSVAANSTVQWNYSQANSFNKRYYWKLTIYDGTTNVSNIYYFNTNGRIPTTYLITPKNQSTSVNRQPKCKIKANDSDGGTLAVNFYENSTGSWIKRQLNSSVSANATVQWNYSQASSYSTKYWWKATIYDGTTNITRLYYFISKASLSHIPTTYLMTPKNQSIDVNKQPKCRIWANDTAGGTLAINFYEDTAGTPTPIWTRRQTNSSAANQTVQWNHSLATSYDTEYCWKATIDDGTTNISNAYCFTTKASIHIPTTYLITPKNQSTSVNRQPKCRIWANDTGGGTLAINFYENTTGGWIKRQLNSSSTANQTFQWNYTQATSLNNKYYWKVTIDDGTTNITRLYYFTTKAAPSHIPITYLIIPKNQTTNVNKQPNCRIWTNDTAGGTLTVNFYENTTTLPSPPYYTWVRRQKNSSVAANSTVQWNYSQASSYSTKYWWKVTTYDGTTNISRLYYFTTKSYFPTTHLITPKNESININRQPKCRIWANSSGNALTINFYENSTGSWIKRQLNSSVPANSTVQWNYSQATSNGTTYFWKTTIYDGTANISRTYFFTTKGTNTYIRTLNIIQQITQPLLLHWVQNLTKNGAHVTGTAACRAVGKYIYNEFKNMSLWTVYNNWTYAGYTSSNIVATINGTNTSSTRQWIMCGHYDTVSAATSGGADDDSSGVAAVLAAAYFMRNERFNDTIKFIAWSGEEEGLYGSYVYAVNAKTNDTNIGGVLNGDMISYQNSTNNFRIYHDGPSFPMYNFSYAVKAKYNPYLGLTVVDGGYNWQSDHSSFWGQGYHALFYFENIISPYYHKKTDNITNMNFSYYVKTAKCITAIFSEYAGLTTSAVISNFQISGYAVASGHKRHAVDNLNFSATITNANAVYINIITPRGNTINQSILSNHSAITNSYWCNRNFSNGKNHAQTGYGWPDVSYGNGTYQVYIFAKGISGSAKSSTNPFNIYPNADVTMDNYTTFFDLTAITGSNWGAMGPNRFYRQDVNGDGYVNFNDLTHVTGPKNWGWSSTP